MNTLFPQAWLAEPFAGLPFTFPVGLPAGSEPSGAPFPALNAWADDQALHVEAELPGVPASSLEVTVEGDELTLAGERPARAEEGLAVHRRERTTGRFARVVRLPVPVDAGAVSASLRDGVLEVTLPRAAASRPRRIEIQSPR